MNGTETGAVMTSPARSQPQRVIAIAEEDREAHLAGRVRR
jgi:hypothetical protein